MEGIVLFKASIYQFFVLLLFTFNAVAQELTNKSAADLFLAENSINLSTPVTRSAYLLG